MSNIFFSLIKMTTVIGVFPLKNVARLEWVKGLGLICLPNCFLLVLYPPIFSSCQTLLPRHFYPGQLFSQEFFLLYFFMILLVHYTPRTLFSCQLIYQRLFPPDKLYSLDLILPANNSTRTFSSWILFPMVDNSPNNKFSQYTVIQRDFPWTLFSVNFTLLGFWSSI